MKDFFTAFNPAAIMGETLVTEKIYENGIHSIDIRTEIKIPNIPFVRYIWVKILILWIDWRLSGDLEGIQGDAYPYCYTRTCRLWYQVAVIQIFLTVTSEFEIPFSGDKPYAVKYVTPYPQSNIPGNPHWEYTWVWKL